jgi:hypothetical protein
MPTVIKIGVVLVLLLIVITFTQNSRSKQVAPGAGKTPAFAPTSKPISELQGTVAELGRKGVAEDRARRAPSKEAPARKKTTANLETPPTSREEGEEHSVPRGLSRNHFTVGSTKNEVLAIQGTPDRFTERSLHYGTSDVLFRDGRVVSWYNGYPKLKIRMLPTSSTDKSYFTVGSTKDEILAIQGTPDRFTDSSFHYGTSDVFFQDGRVVSWYNGYPKLKVRMLPATSTDKSHFTVGSTKNEVLAIQGTPDRFTERSLHYGTSDVVFKNGRVSSWYNGYPKLRVKMLPSSGSAGKGGPTGHEESSSPDS